MGELGRPAPRGARAEEEMLWVSTARLTRSPSSLTGLRVEGALQYLCRANGAKPNPDLNPELCHLAVCWRAL